MKTLVFKIAAIGSVCVLFFARCTDPEGTDSFKDSVDDNRTHRESRVPKHSDTSGNDMDTVIAKPVY